MLKLMNQKLDFQIHSLGEATLKEVSLNRENRSLEEVSLVKTPYPEGKNHPILLKGKRKAILIPMWPTHNALKGPCPLCPLFQLESNPRSKEAKL